MHVRDPKQFIISIIGISKRVTLKRIARAALNQYVAVRMIRRFKPQGFAATKM